MNIRLEQPKDYREVENLTREAFWNVYAPGCVEHFVLHQYRNNPDFIPELDFVMEEDGKIVGSGMINRIQNDFYASVQWRYSVPDEQVCVLHTMGISPSEFGKGHAGAFLDFYEAYAVQHGCTELRIDTNVNNHVARGMYRRRGYEEVGAVPTVFNGIPGVSLILLEKHL